MNIAVIFALLAALQSMPDGDVSEHSGTQAPQTHVYKSVDGRELLADVYLPNATGPVPVIVWLHGGALIFGDRSWVREEFLDFSRREGLAVVSLDYRLAPETKLPEVVGTDFPPTMLIHGLEDRDVPASESRLFAEILSRHGCRARARARSRGGSRAGGR